MSANGRPIGLLRADEWYSTAEFRRRVGWQEYAFRNARRSGLPVRQVGKTLYVLGDEALGWFREQKLAGADPP